MLVNPSDRLHACLHIARTHSSAQVASLRMTCVVYEWLHLCLSQDTGLSIGQYTVASVNLTINAAYFRNYIYSQIMCTQLNLHEL